MPSIEDMMKGMEGAEGFGSGQYFDEGRYNLRVKAIKLVTSKRPENAGKHFFTAEFEVLSSSNPAVDVGASRSYQVKIEGNTYAFADIKNFAFSLIGVDPKNAPDPKKDPRLHQLATRIVMALCDEDYAKKVTTEDPEAAAFVGEIVGSTVRLEAFKKATRPKHPGGPSGLFTIHTWSPADEETAAA